MATTLKGLQTFPNAQNVNIDNWPPHIDRINFIVFCQQCVNARQHHQH